MEDITKTLINHRARATLILESDKEPDDILQYIKRPDQRAFSEDELSEEKSAAVLEALHKVSRVFNLDLNKLIEAVTGSVAPATVSDKPITKLEVTEEKPVLVEPIEPDPHAFEEELNINAPLQIEKSPASQITNEELLALAEKTATHLGSRKPIGNILRKTYGVKNPSQLKPEDRIRFKQDLEELLSAG